MRCRTLTSARAHLAAKHPVFAKHGVASVRQCVSAAAKTSCVREVCFFLNAAIRSVLAAKLAVFAQYISRRRQPSLPSSPQNILCSRSMFFASVRAIRSSSRRKHPVFAQYVFASVRAIRSVLAEKTSCVRAVCFRVSASYPVRPRGENILCSRSMFSRVEPSTVPVVRK